MKIGVRFATKTGNTGKLAEAIASELGVEALDVSVPVSEPVDILFLGSAVYGGGVSEEVRRFIDGLNPEMIGEVVNFSTAALLPSTYNQIGKLLNIRGISLSKAEFHCRGQFHFLHRGRPDEKDLKAVREFARHRVAEKA